MTYARTMLMIHKPWFGSQIGNSSNYVEEFHTFVNYERNKCPRSLLISYDRARNNFMENRIDKERVAQDTVIQNDEAPDECADIMALTGKHQTESNTEEQDFCWPLGEENYDWSKPHIQVCFLHTVNFSCLKNLKIKFWTHCRILEFEMKSDH